MLKKKYRNAIFITILGLLPIFIYGLISIWFGWFFFPNSVLLKGRSLSSIKINKVIKYINPVFILNYPHILVLLVGAVIIFYINCIKNKNMWSELSIFSFIFIGITVMQLYFAIVGLTGIYLTRYDAHLIALGIILIFFSVKNYFPPELSIDYIKLYILNLRENINKKSFSQILIAILILIFFFVLLIYRSHNTIRIVPKATNNIYEQQYHMGLFVDKYYDGECIAANDIGAINYLADVVCIDLKGLGDKSIARHKMEDDELDEDIVDMETKRKNCKIAIIYEDDGKGWDFEIPLTWTKVGEWTIRGNVVCYSGTVSFWSVDPDETNNLIQNLLDFSKYLPHTVKESGNYTL